MAAAVAATLLIAESVGACVPRPVTISAPAILIAGWAPHDARRGIDLPPKTPLGQIDYDALDLVKPGSVVLFSAQLGDADEAIAWATESIELAGDSPLGSAYFALGLGHTLKGEVDAADEAYRKAVSVLRDRSEWREAVQACRAWADALRAAGRSAEAFEALETAAELAERASTSPRIAR